MQQEHEIEMQIWEYLDGLCAEADEARIAALIVDDAAWRRQYEIVKALHSELGTVAMEQPSMRFSRNVMDAVAQEHVAPSTKAYLNKWIVRGIAAFFFLLIGTLLATIVGTSDEEAQKTVFSLPRLNLPALSLGSVGYGLLMLNIVAALILLDAWMKGNRLTSRQRT